LLKNTLTPPPLPSHPVSLVIEEPLASNRVPPQASAWGAEAGKSHTNPLVPSNEPSSPVATVTTIPRFAAS
jgi:hypothetical protein